VALLNNELFDILRLLFKQGDTRRKPFFCLVSSCPVCFGNLFLNLVVKFLGSRLKFAFDCFRVKLQQTDISAGGQICLKVLLVVLKQLHNIGEVLNRIFKTLLNQNIDVELLVSPIDLKDRLEASQESAGFAVGVVNYFVHSGFLGDEELLVADPSQRIQSKSFLVRLIPLIAHNVVPLLKRVSVHFQVTVFRPPGEAGYLIETLLEVLLDLILKILLIRLHFDPEVVHIRKCLSVQLHNLHISTVSCLFLFLIISLYRLKL